MADKLLTDDAVVKMLQEEAKSATRNFASQGLEAYLPRRCIPYPRGLVYSVFAKSSPCRSTTQAPRTNTRFLRNLIRETDSHNQALLAKEAEEAQAKFREHKRKEEKRSRRELEQEHSWQSSRHRSYDDEDDRRPKRLRVDTPDHERNRLSPPRESYRYRDEDRASSHRKKSRERKDRRSRSRSRKRSSSRDQKRRRRDVEDSDDDHVRQKQRSHHGKDRHRREKPRERGETSRKRSSRRDSSLSSDTSGDRERRKYRRTSRDRSKQSKRRSSRARRRKDETSRQRTSLSASDSDGHQRRRSRQKDGHHSNSHANVKERTMRNLSPLRSSKSNGSNFTHDTNASDSDPLEEIVGPLPPPPAPKPRVRGRGAISSAARNGMDTRFSSTYDPTTDVTLDMDEQDDWDQALEALQARAKFKQSQGERMRAAGFSEEEVKVWEKGGKEKSEDDVKWAKKGEGREWDRGKVVNGDGDDVSGVDMEYGRLK